MLKTIFTTVVGWLALAGVCPVAAQHHISCRPAAERGGDLGCWIMAREVLQKLPPGAPYWHLDIYPTRSAAEADKGSHGTVIEAAGKVWLLTIAEPEWRSRAGQRAAQIGPLPIGKASEHVAIYMETMLPPGFAAPIHSHPGPEAVYAIAGEVCIETPEGKNIERPGSESHVIPGDRPMALVVTGREHHRSLVLILHDGSERPIIPVDDWKPKGLCQS
jgi:quercetin dioxygenase-like cupin family protein